MSDIEVVIKLDEKDFEIMKHNIAVDNPLCPIGQKEMVTKIANGTPLPKGHGILIDVDTLKETFIEPNSFLKCNEKGFWCFTSKEIKNAPTIIEADKGDKE